MYELWEMSRLGDGEPLVPFFLNFKSTDYNLVYDKFRETILKKPCVIVLTKRESGEKH